MNKQIIGDMGQAAAEKYLCAKNYSIVARNFRSRYGEIDLIAHDGSYVVFVEVKLRKNITYGHPREAVGHTKQRRIYNTACHYIATQNLTDCDFRFDVVEILTEKGMLKVIHIENAFN